MTGPERAGLLVGSAALVTGGGRNIGRAIALEMGRAGADVVVVGRSAPQCEAVAEEVRLGGRRAIAAIGDIRDAATLERALDAADEADLRVDILVNNAGLLVFEKFWEYDEATYHAIIETNLMAGFMAAQAVARRWIRDGVAGRIINMASVEAEVAYPDQAPYAASKGAVLTLTRVLAREWGPYGIRVNAIGPGPIDTPLSERFRAMSEAGVVFHRLGAPAEVGQVAVFLASPMASFVTGAILYVDGGYMLA